MTARFLAGAILMVLAATPAVATPLEDRLREQLTSTVTQLRELQGKQASLEAAKAAAEAERDAAKARASAGASPAASRELAAARNQNAALSAKANSAAAGLAAAQARAAELETKLATAQAELAQLRQTTQAATAAAEANDSALQAEIFRNARLVAAGRELAALHVKRYGHGDFPPVQALRTKIENEAFEMRDKVNTDAIVPNAGTDAPK